MKLTVIAALFGIELPRTVNELYLSNGRIFKNPILLNENWDLSLGPNLTLYKEHEGKREIDRDVVKYLLDLEIDTSNGSLDMGSFHVSLSGSGGASFPARTGAQLKGRIKEEFEKVTLPFLLATKARIIAIPVKVQGGNRNEVSKNGIDQSLNIPISSSIYCKLSKEDCSFISKLSDKISSVDLSPYKVPIEIFQDSFHNVNDIERGLSLITALESLFSQGSDSISFKLAYRTSCFLYFNDTKMYSTFKFIKKAYKYRSELVHGNKDKRIKAKEWFKTNLLELEDIVRRALFIIIELLQTGIKLTGESNLDKYLFEQVLTGKSSSFQKSVSSVGKLSTLQTFL